MSSTFLSVTDGPLSFKHVQTPLGFSHQKIMVTKPTCSLAFVVKFAATVIVAVNDDALIECSRCSSDGGVKDA
jgi:hypothetical protein